MSLKYRVSRWHYSITLRVSCPNLVVTRDVLGAETSMSSGLMAGKQGILVDRNNAAYDMKASGDMLKL
jgi:hypothetical protein